MLLFKTIIGTISILDVKQIILELMALEQYFEQGRQRCYSIRKDLEQFSAPAPSGDGVAGQNKKMMDILSKRKSTFYRNKHAK